VFNKTKLNGYLAHVGRICGLEVGSMRNAPDGRLSVLGRLNRKRLPVAARFLDLVQGLGSRPSEVSGYASMVW
jgi:hypothetical protein